MGARRTPETPKKTRITTNVVVLVLTDHWHSAFNTKAPTGSTISPCVSSGGHDRQTTNKTIDALSVSSLPPALVSAKQSLGRLHCCFCSVIRLREVGRRDSLLHPPPFPPEENSHLFARWFVPFVETDSGASHRWKYWRNTDDSLLDVAPLEKCANSSYPVNLSV